jgi:hypothetical protein
MPETVQTDAASQSMAGLVGGIINDAQQLIRQEMALARREVHEELNKAKVAAISLGTGMAVVVMGGLMFVFMLVHLLHWLTSPHDGPQADPASLPLWVCYLIIGALFVLLGVVLFLVAKAKVTQINVVPPQTAATMKENVQWIKNQT